MFLNENTIETQPPIYKVEELSMDEALLVLVAEKEILESRQAIFASYAHIVNWDQSPSNSSVGEVH